MWLASLRAGTSRRSLPLTPTQESIYGAEVRKNKKQCNDASSPPRLLARQNNYNVTPILHKVLHRIKISNYIRGMETNTNNTKAQGAEVTKRKRTYSPNYLITQFGTVLKNLIEYEMVDEQDVAQMRKLGKKMKERFLSIDMF